MLSTIKLSEYQSIPTSLSDNPKVGDRYMHKVVNAVPAIGEVVFFIEVSDTKPPLVKIANSISTKLVVATIIDG